MGLARGAPLPLDPYGCIPGAGAFHGLGAGSGPNDAAALPCPLLEGLCPTRSAGAAKL